MNKLSDESLTPSLKCSPRALNFAVTLFTEWRNQPTHLPLDRIVETQFRNARFLNSGERRWISDALYATVRFLLRDSALLAAHSLPDTPENHLALYASEPLLLKTEEGVPLLETIASVLPSADDPAAYLRTTLSFPDEMATELEELLGAEAISAGEGLNRQAATVLRVNTLKARRHPVLYEFVGSTPTRYSPWGVELTQRVNLPSLPNYKAGHYEIQDEASQIAVLLTNAKPNETVIEIGAGSGGKTLALAALMENRGRIVAIDVTEERLRVLGKRAERAGVTGIEMLALPADADGVWQPQGNSVRRMERLAQVADCVFIDSPCTGSGVLRRSPDTKWRAVVQSEFATLQQALLRQSAQFVKLNGVLVYITCALERWQNEEAIAQFLQSEVGSAFAEEPSLPRLQAALRRFGSPVDNLNEGLESFTTGNFIRTYPHRHSMDAFFMACLRRKVS